MHKDSNAINWFEIPVTNFERAKKFYETIFGIQMHSQNMNGYMMGFFPSYTGKASGAIIHGEDCVPSKNGTMVYLNSNPDMTPIINKVETAGGKIIMPKTQITPELGFQAVIIDTEGNKVALHSQK